MQALTICLSFLISSILVTIELLEQTFVNVKVKKTSRSLKLSISHFIFAIIELNIRTNS